MTSDQHLALAYYCLAVSSIGSVRALPVADRVGPLLLDIVDLRKAAS